MKKTLLLTMLATVPFSSYGEERLSVTLPGALHATALEEHFGLYCIQPKKSDPCIVFHSSTGEEDKLRNVNPETAKELMKKFIIAFSERGGPALTTPRGHWISISGEKTSVGSLETEKQQSSVQKFETRINELVNQPIKP